MYVDEKIYLFQSTTTGSTARTEISRNFPVSQLHFCIHYCPACRRYLIFLNFFDPDIWTSLTRHVHSGGHSTYLTYSLLLFLLHSEIVLWNVKTEKLLSRVHSVNETIYSIVLRISIVGSHTRCSSFSLH